MKLNIAYPPTGCQKKLEVEDEAKLRAFYDKRISQEVAGEALGEEFKGYIFKIKGGQDKQGFPMKQGVLTTDRVRLLLKRGDSCFRGHGRRDGERRRKSVRGCIVSHDLSVLNLVIVRKGEAELPGLTDEEKPRQRGPKRASRIRKMFNLSKEDDVRHYVKIYGKKIEKDGKTRVKCPKIQRLVTPRMLHHKRRLEAVKKNRIVRKKQQAADYHKLLVTRLQEERERRSESLAKKRAQRLSVASKE
ncbi:ribosomal protein S6e [Helicosporidium sp. ATCC 50920]|nr:ribosomal protein S6e [Helicosporidium sp. ATCC 50920]|eukprot:KDD74799.1 ribosomal protein S6e [Helicosporidium sp. ATCC 50920]